MASTSPASARRTASSTAWPAIRPAASGVAPRCPLPSKVTSASSGRSASAFSTTSGPIPRGSPSVTASRGRRLETDVDVRGATQQVEMVLDGELLAQAVPDAILHLVEPQLALGKALQQLEHHEPRPPRSGGDFEHRFQPGNGVLTDRLLVIGRQLGQGEGVSQLGLARVGVATGQRVERRAVGERVVHRIGLAPGDGDLRRGNGGLDQDVARQDLRRLRALHLDDVETELGADDIGDRPGLRRNATSSNSLTITPRRNQPSAPPCSRETLSAEYFFATSANPAPPPCRSATTRESASCNARELAAESGFGTITIWRNEMAAGRLGCCARFASQNARISASDGGIGRSFPFCFSPSISRCCRI